MKYYIMDFHVKRKGPFYGKSHAAILSWISENIVAEIKTNKYDIRPVHHDECVLCEDDFIYQALIESDPNYISDCVS